MDPANFNLKMVVNLIIFLMMIIIFVFLSHQKNKKNKKKPSSTEKIPIGCDLAMDNKQKNFFT